ncbi:MAG TPA: hypothetical protein VKB09_13165, partial [Thermomicrobiales bacterium]|nr:hypothetical protein [Thermomicrobiales bacterium]
RKHLAPIEGVDPKKLAETGWGVLFAADDPQANEVREALSPLLRHREEQAKAIKEGRYYELIDGQGYRPDESKSDFLARHGASEGPVNPDKLPYYLLFVGDPARLPFRFQYLLDVQHSIGRLHFDTLDEYHSYARSVVAAETGTPLPRRAAFVGVQNANDDPTNLSATKLVQPLVQHVAGKHADWQVEPIIGGAATKEKLLPLFGGASSPALLFTASHGMGGFTPGEERQLTDQGALLCQDWPGPENWQEEGIPDKFYLAGRDVPNDAKLLGLLAFHFACYGAGCPQYDDFAHQGNGEREEIALRSFVAQLPRRLLGHPNGGALAVVGHVDRAWGSSFLGARGEQQVDVFTSTFDRLLGGHPVGSALEYFNNKHAELSTTLTGELEEGKWGKQLDDLMLADLWTANNDARGYVILGDPAVRLCTGDAPATGERVSLDPVHFTPAPRPAEELPTIEIGPAPAGPASQDLTQAIDQLTAAIDRLSLRTAGTPSGPVAYGLGDWLSGNKAKEAVSKLTDTIERFAGRLAEALEKAVDEASSVTVETYVAENLTGVNYVDGRYDGATLRAITRMSFDGDTQVCVPTTGGELDASIWGMHADMVERAQANRAELLKTAVEAATGLLGR